MKELKEQLVQCLFEFEELQKSNRNLQEISELLLSRNYAFSVIIKTLLKSGIELDEIDGIINQSSLLSDIDIDLQRLFFEYLELE